VYVLLRDCRACGSANRDVTDELDARDGAVNTSYTSFCRECGNIDVYTFRLPRPDGRTLIISSGNDETVRVWDFDGGEHLHHLTGHTSGVSSVAALPRPDGRTVIISGGSDDQTVWVWDPDGGEQLHHLTGHTRWVMSVAA
jgi:WD40 repeat protein